MDNSLTKDILRNQLASGQQTAAELLYNRFSGMLYSYILQFIPDRQEASEQVIKVFCGLIPRLEEALDSSLSIYCWLQVEARKMILPYAREGGEKSFFLLLEDASPEHQWVFRELFLLGRQQEDLALHSGKDINSIGRLLMECLIIIRKKIG